MVGSAHSSTGMRRQGLGQLQIIAAAVLFSTGGAAIKACSFSSWQIAGFRSGLAALAVLVVLPSARRGWSRRSAAVGLAYSATMILFVLANKLTTSANTIFLQDTAPLYVLLLGPLLLRESIRLRDGVFMGVVATGLVLFFVGAEPPRETATNPLAGNILAAVAGVSWALTIMGMRSLGRKTGGGTGAISAVAIGNLVAFLVCLPLAWPVPTGTAGDWALVAFLGVFQIGLAYVLMTRGIAHVPALTASILLLIEPVINPIWTFFIHGELPGPWSLGGCTLILVATMINIGWAGRGGRKTSKRQNVETSK
ncbi:MAG: DMT family transporter [Phycisphaerae bacterium]